MTGPSTENAETTNADTTCRCPTCRAEQPWSDTCRRCQCDLSLLRQAAAVWQQQRRHCLVCLRAGRLDEALAAASQCQIIWPNACSTRLLAVGRLLTEDWSAALALARQACRPNG